MQFFKRKLFGFSLFEVLLVLLVASMIAVAAIKYAKHQQEVSAAQLYGLNLYTYGQGVYSYVYSNAATLASTGTLPGPTTGSKNSAVPAAVNSASAWQNAPANFLAQYPAPIPSQYELAIVINSGTNPGSGGKADPITWIAPAYAGSNASTAAAYLPPNFNFNSGISPLIVAVPLSATSPDTTKQGNFAFTTTIFFSKIHPTLPPLINVTAGALFEQDRNKYTLMPALTQDAITHANNLYTAYQGAAAISYAYPYLGSSGPNPAAKTAGALNPMAQTGGGNSYLQVKGANNGGNTMQGDISFGAQGNIRMMSSAPEQSNSIVQVDNIGFRTRGDASSPSTYGTSRSALSNVGMILMGFSPADSPSQRVGIYFVADQNSTNGLYGGGVIRNLTNLSFAPLANGNVPSSIDGLTTLGFAVSGTTQPSISGLRAITFDGSNSSKISNLRTISFSNGDKFTGIHVISLPNTGRPGQSGKVDTNSGQDLKDNNGLNLYPSSSFCYLSHTQGSGGCHVLTGSSGQWVVSWKSQISCEVTCISFGK
jgi:hypothetical protein